MHVLQVLNEIGRLAAKDWTGEDSMSPIAAKKMIALPGGSGLMYTLEKKGDMLDISIIDPKISGEFKPPMRFTSEFPAEYDARIAKMKKLHNKGIRKIAQLSLYKSDIPVFKNAYSVDTITTDLEYRGMGLSKALYGIVLSVLKCTLVAGNSQTPGGRLNWVSLSRIPGVEIKGLLCIHDDYLNDDKITNALMNLGGQYVGKGRSRYDHDHYWMFDVQAGDKEMIPAVKNKLSKLYGSDEFDVTMFAQFAG